jgi:hypothetical protein
VKYEDGTEARLPYKEYGDHGQRLIHEHGKLTQFKREPKSADDLRTALATARHYREKESRPAVFKVRVQNQKKPSIRRQLATGKKNNYRKAEPPCRSEPRPNHKDCRYVLVTNLAT